MSCVQELPRGITCIDTGYHRPALAACYLIEQGGRAAFVDSGTTQTVPRLLELLASKGLSRKSVAYVMPTHVHLDHAGGAGELMRHLPNAKLVIHPRGARHMIDPSKLIAGATAVYGETAFRENFGELVPVPEERVLVADDGLTLDLNGRSLTFRDTPGHARHHYSIYDETSNGFFTGDIFGLCYPGLDCARPFVFPTTTPVQFDPVAWHRSLDLLLSYHPERIYLTHYGMVEDVERLAGDLRRRLDQLAKIARQAAHRDDSVRVIKDEMSQMLMNELAANGCRLSANLALDLFKLDLELNAHGLQIWLERNERETRDA